MTPAADPAAPPIGILAGGGSLPAEIADSIRASGRAVHVVALASESDGDLARFSPVVVPWGAIGRLTRSFRDAGCRDLVIIGKVRRPDLARIRPDLGFFLSLPAIWRLIRAGGDDGVLRRVVRFFEGQGFTVRSPLEVAPSLAAPLGPLGRIGLDAAATADIAFGFRAIADLGPLDIGQAVVVRSGRLLAVEGAEGTDGLLARLAGGQARGGILVKRPKPTQELRIDLPTIGPATVSGCVAAGLAGIAVAAGHVLLADRAGLIASADAARVWVAGAPIADEAGPSAARDQTRDPVQPALAVLGGLHADAGMRADAARAAAVLTRLGAYAGGAAVFVARRHVLAVAVDEEPQAFAARVPALRQWGDARRRRRRGIFGVSGVPLTAGLVDAAVQAGAAGLLVAAGPRDVPEAAAFDHTAIALADRSRVVVMIGG